MKRLLVSFSIVTLVACLGFGLKKEKLVGWKSVDQLNWSDFQGREKKGSAYDAMTDSGNSFAYSGDSDGVEVQVFSTFNKATSWYKQKKKTDYLLNHERGHFNITEIINRRARKALITGEFTSKNFSKSFSKIVSQANRDREKMQRLYDKETDHSLNKEAQAEWDDKIADELNFLSEFKGGKLQVIPISFKSK